MKTDSASLSDHHYFGFIVEDRYLQKTFHRADDSRPFFLFPPDPDQLCCVRQIIRGSLQPSLFTQIQVKAPSTTKSEPVVKLLASHAR